MFEDRRPAVREELLGVRLGMYQEFADSIPTRLELRDAQRRDWLRRIRIATLRSTFTPRACDAIFSLTSRAAYAASSRARRRLVPGRNTSKAGREHRVTLSPRCLEPLDRAAELADGGPCVFPGRSPRTPLSGMVFLMLLRRMNRDDITAHGFRSSFRDWAAERSSAPRAVVEAVLAHVVKDKAEAAYLRSDLFELRRTLMESWARFATSTSTPAKVIPLQA